MKQAPYSKAMDFIVNLLTFSIIAFFIGALIVENF